MSGWRECKNEFNLGEKRKMAPFRIGLYGCGNRTVEILKKTVSEGLAKVTLCYDIRPEKAGQFAEKYGARACSKAELLESNEVDMFLIALFPAAHPDALLETIPCGKPVYIEKPICSFMKDVRRLVPVLGKGYVHVGLSYDYIPVFRQLRDLVRNGKIGELLAINFNWLDDGFKKNMTEQELENWRFQPETGGELTQHYCHCFDWFRKLSGDFRSIAAVSAKFHDNPLCLEDIWDFILTQKNGPHISMHASMRNPRFTVIGYLEGTAGSLEYEWNDPSSITFFPGGRGKTSGEPIPVENNIPDALEEFIESFRAGKKPVVSLSDGIWSVLPPIYARESARTGKTQFFPDALQELL